MHRKTVFLAFVLVLATTGLLVSGCPRPVADAPGEQTETIEPGPPVGLEVSPAQPQNERPDSP